MANGKVLSLRSATKPQKATHTTVDTIMFDRDQLTAWETPDFQRPIRENEKVKACAVELKESGGVIPGVLTIGVLGGRSYLIDGGHRRRSFLLTDLEVGYADVRTHYFESMADMADEFVRLNSQMVKMRPDDILRGLEASCPPLANLRAKCPFVGYDMIRRSDRSPIVSMSLVLRSWRGSATEVPAAHGTGSSAASLGAGLTAEDSTTLADFLNIAHAAWGRDEEYARLWGSLNMILCMWLYRRTVIAPYSAKTPKTSRDLFGKCMMSLSANSKYLDWLVGRLLGDRDRSPAYTQIKGTFTKRIETETSKPAFLPKPAWNSGHEKGRR